MRSDTITMERELAEAEAALTYLGDKAIALDTLSDRIASGTWRVEQWEPVMQDIQGVKITIAATGERITGATLAEAIRLAMDAEER